MKEHKLIASCESDSSFIKLNEALKSDSHYKYKVVRVCSTMEALSVLEDAEFDSVLLWQKSSGIGIKEFSSLMEQSFPDVNLFIASDYKYEDFIRFELEWISSNFYYIENPLEVLLEKLSRLGVRG